MPSFRGSPGSGGGRLAATALLACAAFVALVVLSAGTPAAQGQGARNGRLDARLSELAQAYRDGGLSRAEARAEESGLDLEGSSVRVIVEARPGLSGATRAALSARGTEIEGSHGDLVQALVPVAALEALAPAPGVERVRPPLTPVTMTTSQGVGLLNADDWQAQGVTGAGVKVAIVDLGFQGYQSKLGTELPASVTARSFRADEDITGGGEVHGTGVAEIVHDMAPDAELYLVNFDTEVELAAAADWLASEGVRVANASWGYFTSGPGDGTGIVDEIISDSVDDGIMWSVSAANHAQRHWSGQFNDVDEDGWHAFATSPQEDEGNQVIGSLFGLVVPGEPVVAELKWDDPYGASCNDFDLYLLRTEGQQVVTVAASQNPQFDGTSCVPGADPVEAISFVAGVTDTYHLAIAEYASSEDVNFHLYTYYQNLEYQVAANSLAQPADNPDVLTVAAVPYSSPSTIEAFSSRGPTTDGRIKPDISGPDGVSNSVYTTGFYGTSASAPHMAGAAALLLERLACFTPAQQKAYLEANVVDLGAAGKDNTFGSGRLLLDAKPPSDTDLDGTGDACDPDIDGDGTPNESDAEADGDGVLNVDEPPCGSDPYDGGMRPERKDGAFAGVDDDGDGATDEALPGGAAGYDCDGDGSTGAAEASIFVGSGGLDQDPCGANGWPLDLHAGSEVLPSQNRVNVFDLNSFLAPTRYLDTDVGDHPGDVRWDILPGPGTLGSDINAQDFIELVAIFPPMLDGLRAFDGPECPWPP